MKHRFHASVDQIPPVKGAYALVIVLEAPVTVTLPGGKPTVLAAGRYLYCGSANGPGGLRARLARHMRKGKRLRWHVDRLTEAGRTLGAWTAPDGDECRLVEILGKLSHPLPGFGSSDCGACVSHLLAWPAGVRLPRRWFGEEEKAVP